MTTLKTTVSEILGEHTDVHSTMFHSEMPLEPSDYTQDETDSFLLALQAMGIKLEHKANHGGEGEGDKYWSVYEFVQGHDSVHVKFDGWYASHCGSAMTDYFFVEPKQVTVTKYV
jgi:hypothetical protein